ncbi:Na+:solute symporter [Maribellus sp. CM-23]|uniref:sodium:solute symporter family protein n=1 Tax=Maribellus sp. CM-23 TaxID=2781026 RepID=UPI001F41A4F9|nr:sodium:solute symporter family protein [Maribellus sp. CM-23]MCE4564615.1 Na+:solute symporter [Maribellus sp. CM-23]
MKLTSIDIVIIFTYLVSTVVIGLVLKKVAQKSKSNYLLGGNKLPWYMLGLSNASGMFDISGTMWLVTLLFVYGLKSIWIPWLWPVFNQIFLMVFLSIWLRRSKVTTGAEWINTRFGRSMDSNLSHGVVVVFALILCLGYLAYGFIGLGKFVMIFIPWDIVQPHLPFQVPLEYVPHVYGIAFTLFAVFYAVLGGMTSIVWADVLQYIIMTISAILIGVLAMKALAVESLHVPEGWHSPFFGWRLDDLDWKGIINEVNSKISSDGYSLFSIFFMMMLFKGLLVSLAGPAPTYDMQKILSTKSPKEAAKMSGFVSVVLMPIRYFMIAGFAVLAILYYDKLNLLVAGQIDFEQILPSAIAEFVPVGFMGLLLAGLLAAFNSTFAGTLNAAQAYIVNDIYLRYVKPEADNRQIKNMNYITGVVVVIISIIFGVFAQDVNSMLQWIVSGLYGSYVVSNVLKWYWWRFNGYGYFWGMVFGLIPALIFPRVTDTLDLYYFPWLFVISLAGALLGTFLSKPTDEATLKDFYKTVNPWGFWGPVRDKVVAENPGFVPNKTFKRDMLNVVLGTIGQTALVALPIYIVLQEAVPIWITIGIAVVCGYILKKTWWDTLPEQ